MGGHPPPPPYIHARCLCAVYLQVISRCPYHAGGDDKARSLNGLTLPLSFPNYSGSFSRVGVHFSSSVQLKAVFLFQTLHYHQSVQVVAYTILLKRVVLALQSQLVNEKNLQKHNKTKVQVFQYTQAYNCKSFL